MAQNDAMRFIEKIREDNDFRKSLYAFPDTDALFKHLKENGYDFTNYDFEEESRAMHLKCQTEEEAEDMKMIINWWKMLMRPK